MDSIDETTCELKVVYVGNLEVNAISVLEEIKQEFWNRRPINEIRIHTNRQNNHISSAYLFQTAEDAKLFGDLLKDRSINFFYHLESKFDNLATIGMNKKEIKEYFESKNF